MKIPEWLVKVLATLLIGAGIAWAGTINTEVVTHDAQITTIQQSLNRIENKVDRLVETKEKRP